MPGFCRIPLRLSTLWEKQKRINGSNLWRARTGALPSGTGAAGQALICPSMEVEKHRRRTSGGDWPARRSGGMADIRWRTLGYIQRRRSGSGRLPLPQRLPPRDPLGQRHAAQSGGSTAQAGADGTASSGSGTAAAPGSGSNGSSDGGFDDTATGQTVEEAMKELFGSLLVAYSDSTGQYEALDTASLAQAQPVRVADVLAHRNSADSADAAADSADADSGADHSFSVSWGINRSLDTAERQGFVLIALVAGAGMIVLITLFCKVRRRKK